MDNFKAMSICVLTVVSCLAMEQKPVAGPSAGAQPEKAVPLVNRTCEVAGFFGFGELSPCSEQQRLYEELLRHGKLSSRDADETKYRLALIYMDKNRPASEIRPLLEAALAEKSFLRPEIKTDVQYRLACLYVQEPDSFNAARNLLREALASNLLCSREEADAKQKLASLIISGRGEECDDELATRLFQESLDSGELGEDVAKNTAAKLSDLKIARCERYLLERATVFKKLDAKLLAYAQYKLAGIYTHGRGLRRDHDMAERLLTNAIGSKGLSELQRKDAWRQFNMCSRVAVQKNIEALISDGQARPLDLCALAVAYKDDHDDYGDSRARTLLKNAIASGALNALELATAQYHLACLCDEHRGQRKTENDGRDAHKLLLAAIESGFLPSSFLVDAQYRYARLLILEGGDSNYAMAENLLNKVRDSVWLTPRQGAMGRFMLGVIGEHAALEKQRAAETIRFDKLLDEELGKAKDSVQELREKIKAKKLSAKDLAQAQLRLACLLSLDFEAQKSWLEPETLLKTALGSSYLNADQSWLANHILGGGNKKPDNWQQQEERISAHRFELCEEAFLDEGLEKELYKKLVDPESPLLDPMARALVCAKLASMGDAAYVDKKNDLSQGVSAYVGRKVSQFTEDMRLVQEVTRLGYNSSYKKEPDIIEAYDRLLNSHLLTDEQLALINYGYGLFLGRRLGGVYSSEEKAQADGDKASIYFKRAIESGKLTPDQLKCVYDRLSCVKSWRDR